MRKLGFSLVGRQIRQYTHSKDPVEIRIFGLRAGVYESSGQDSPRAPEFQTLEPVLLVNNVQETVDYYSRRLGFHVDFLWGNPPNLGAVSYGDWSPQTVRIQFRAAPPNMDSRIEGEIYILVEPEVETLYQRCQAQGVTICREITSQPWGMREFALQDINGYILRFGKVEKSDFL